MVEQLSSNPLASEINALPERMRKYVHELETDCDPAGEKARIICLEENVAGLTAELERLTLERDEARNASVPGSAAVFAAVEAERDSLRAALNDACLSMSIRGEQPPAQWLAALGEAPASETSAVPRGEDIVDLLEARGDDLSRRAARYIRIKRQTEDGLERELRRMCQKSLAGESSENGSEVTTR